MYIISVTGTKGKTSIVRFLSDIIRHTSPYILRVDNDGAYINGQEQSNSQRSSMLYGQTPSVSPGRYFLHMVNQEMFRDCTSILETSIGCGGPMGLGYKNHDIGIFTNVFTDHIKPDLGIFDQADIARKKNFIFRYIRPGGTAVFNADDPFICSELHTIPQGVRVIPFGELFSSFHLDDHLHSGGTAIQLVGNRIIARSKERSQILLDIGQLPFAFYGQFKPAIFNVMAVLSALYAYYGSLPYELLSQVRSYVSPADGGRLSLLENKEGVRILIDYAHEEQSLLEISRLSKTLTQPGGSTIAVLRLHPAKESTALQSISRSIAKSYDTFCIYDVVDGVQTTELQTRKGVRKPGETASYVAEQLIQSGATNVRVIVEEEKAIEYASSIAKRGDVVVVIYKNNPISTLQLVEKNFRITL